MFSLQKNLQVTAGKVVRLRCESRGGNPPAGLKWFIDEEQLQGRVRLRLEIQLRLKTFVKPFALPIPIVF